MYLAEYLRQIDIVRFSFIKKDVKISEKMQILTFFLII